jgi:cardiolipin synthase
MADGTNRQIFTIPNLLSVFRILLIPLIVWLYCGRRDYPLAAWALVLSGVTDVADGFIARRFHMVSDLGKILDPVADKLTQAAALGCLLTRFPAVGLPLGVMVVKEAVMAVMGLLVIRRTGAVYSAAWHGKLATCVLYAVIFLHVIWYDIPQMMSLLLALAGAGCIVLSLTLYSVQNLRRLRETR